jgi:asparagine synthase (glutamine-hydrolysing)
MKERIMDRYLASVIDLIHPSINQIYNMNIDAARQAILSGDPKAVRQIDGSFALIATEGKIVKLARSLDRPIRYFLAKRTDGPVLIVAERIDQIYDWLNQHGLSNQFHPSYTRMVPAHHIVEIQLIGCPDPDPTYTRFFTPVQNSLPQDLDQIGHLYISALAKEISARLSRVPENSPIGVCFSGGIDSGAVFLVTYWLMRKMGLNPARLKAFVLDLGGSSDVEQANNFLRSLDLNLFLEVIEADASTLDIYEVIKIVEDYKPLDIECAAMGVSLLRGIRNRYPDWKYLIDGDGGDENLKDYPIEENPELTIRSVVNNQLLYQEGWGIGKIKHSLIYSGGLSRSYTRTYAPARHYGFEGFSPFTKPSVVEIAESIPFATLTDGSHERLYGLKGEIVSRGIRAITGMTMPICPKRRFQHGAVSIDEFEKRFPFKESDYRAKFYSLYE